MGSHESSPTDRMPPRSYVADVSQPWVTKGTSLLQTITSLYDVRGALPEAAPAKASPRTSVESHMKGHQNLASGAGSRSVTQESALGL